MKETQTYLPNPSDKEQVKVDEDVKLGGLLKNLQVLTFHSQLLLALSALLILVVLLWATLTTIPIEADGLGVLLTQRGLHQVISKIEGTVAPFPIKVGQRIKAGDLLGQIVNPQYEVKLQAAKVKLDNLRREYERLKMQIAIEREADRAALQREIQANAYILQQMEQESKLLTHDLDVKQKFFSKGLIGYPLVQQAELALVQKEIDIETIKGKLASLNATLARGYRAQELDLKEIEIVKQEREYAIWAVQIENGKVYSSQEGTVLALLKSEGELVQPGAPLLLVESQSLNIDGSFIFYSYFPIDTGKEVQVGTPVKITLPNINHNEFGQLEGVVTGVSEYAVSPKNILRTIYNQTLIETLTKGASAVLEVVVAPLRDPVSPDEYRWTSGKQPPFPITTGTICPMQAVVEERFPLYFVFPLPALKYRPILPIPDKQLAERDIETKSQERERSHGE